MFPFAGAYPGGGRSCWTWALPKNSKILKTYFKKTRRFYPKNHQNSIFVALGHPQTYFLIWFCTHTGGDNFAFFSSKTVWKQIRKLRKKGGVPTARSYPITAPLSKEPPLPLKIGTKFAPPPPSFKSSVKKDGNGGSDRHALFVHLVGGGQLFASLIAAFTHRIASGYLLFLPRGTISPPLGGTTFPFPSSLFSWENNCRGGGWKIKTGGEKKRRERSRKCSLFLRVGEGGGGEL